MTTTPKSLPFNVRVLRPRESPAPRLLSLSNHDPIIRGLTARTAKRLADRLVEIHAEICEKEVFRAPACAACGETLCADHLVVFSAAKEDVERLERSYTNLVTRLKDLVGGMP
jgi:hypothetical protein